MLEKGYIHIYTGDGKGKTTASLGLAIRAVGNGLKVLVLQFLKGKEEYTGEREIAVRLAPELEIRPCGLPGFIDLKNIPDEAYDTARSALSEARQEISSGNWDVVVLDEINTATHFGLLEAGEVVRLMDTKPHGVELIMTGRYAPQEFIERADLVTEMREVKHYFNEGVKARKGIEK